MIVCSKCFNDEELVAFIDSNGKLGACNVYGANSVNTLDIVELIDFFQELVDNLRKFSRGKILRNVIQNDWKLFKSNIIAETILNNILPHLNTKITSAKQKVNYIRDIIDNYTYWEKLKEKLKWSERFITDCNPPIFNRKEK